MSQMLGDTPKLGHHVDDDDDDDDAAVRPPRPKFKRSRTGCAICRRLKKKCDERKPKCTTCWSRGKKCIYPALQDQPPRSNRIDAQLPVQCHKQKDVPLRLEYEAQVQNNTTLSDLAANISPRTDINLSRSLLLNRRARNIPAKVNRLTTLTPTQSMISVMENLVACLEPTTPLFEFGPQEWGSLEVNAMRDDGDRSNYSVQNLPISFVPDSTNDRLVQVFPSQLARQLFNFYITTTSRILITMGTHGPNPFLALTSSVGFFDTVAAENCALRMGMLATSANHYVYNIRSTEKWKEGQEPPILNILEDIGKRFKMAALSNLTIAVSNADYDAQSVNLDIILAACLTLINRDVMSADTSCQENLDFAIALINKRGGPQKMLRQTQSNFCRFLLESFATHEVFGTFTTGKQPVLLNSWTPWWFESIETSRTSWEWESVERQFGFSRPTVDLVARISTLYSRKRMIGVSLKSDRNRSCSRKEMSGITDHLISEATLLLTELEIWGNSLNCIPQHPRVNCGDQIYRYTMKIHLLGDILETPKEDPRISTSVISVLELLSEASCMELVVMLVWPLLITGAFCHVNQRDYVRSLFRAYKPYYCSDLESARIILEKQWENIDAGLGFRPWSEVMHGLGLELLLI